MKGQLPALAMHRHRHAHVLVEHCFRRYKLFLSKVFPEIVFFCMCLSWLQHPTERSAHFILESLLDNASSFFSLFCDVFCIAALRRGLDVQSDVINLISHACEERMRHLTEKVSLVAEHRLDIHKVITCRLSNNNFSIYH